MNPLVLFINFVVVFINYCMSTLVTNNYKAARCRIGKVNDFTWALDHSRRKERSTLLPITSLRSNIHIHEKERKRKKTYNVSF